VLQKPIVHDGLIVVYQNIIALAFILPTGINIAKGPTDLYSAPDMRSSAKCTKTSRQSGNPANIVSIETTYQNFQKLGGTIYDSNHNNNFNIACEYSSKLDKNSLNN
jgi:hypothetical protein